MHATAMYQRLFALIAVAEGGFYRGCGALPCVTYTVHGGGGGRDGLYHFSSPFKPACFLSQLCTSSSMA